MDPQIPRKSSLALSTWIIVPCSPKIPDPSLPGPSTIKADIAAAVETLANVEDEALKILNQVPEEACSNDEDLNYLYNPNATSNPATQTSTTSIFENDDVEVEVDVDESEVTPPVNMLVFIYVVSDLGNRRFS
uniref:Uncharacterized protein n=1 Tax=Panagrolaimus sp. ES5 TaxID=591445 RepID=A0AC34FMS2_9BILA